AEDGIRDATVTGVQTCALPIWTGDLCGAADCSRVGGKRHLQHTALCGRDPARYAGIETLSGAGPDWQHGVCRQGWHPERQVLPEIGRASCRERVYSSVVGVE